MYEQLQSLCAPRVLCEKTPSNANHFWVLQRSQELFKVPLLLHLVRHPYAAIESGVQLMRDILGNLSTSWAETEQEWISTNTGIHNLLQVLAEPKRKLIVRYS